MKESDAKTKWCPMTRIGWQAGAGVAINRHPMDTHGDGSEGVKDLTRCIGSDCAMWREEIPVASSFAERKNNPCGSCGLVQR